MFYTSNIVGLKAHNIIHVNMANEHTLSNKDEVDPSCMKGYKYWVDGIEKENM